MPELPEVETIRLGLEKYLVGHRIQQVEVKLKKLVTGNTADVTGAKVTSIERFGKGLVIHLDNGYAIAIHIKLTGQLIYKGVSPAYAKAMAGKHVSKGKVGTIPSRATHVIFNLDKDATLYYNDFRQFGWIKIVKEGEVAKLPFFRELGPEFVIEGYSSSERSESRSSRDSSRQARTILKLDTFKKILSKSAAPVKAVIMDQQKMGGVGNIYANDGLFLAGIDPRRKAKELRSGEVKKLYNCLLEVLKRGLKYGGASELAFVDALGQEGGYQNHFLVYGQDGEPCPNKNGLIRKFKLGGRGTYFCERCQT